MIDSNESKFDANTKADDPDGSDGSNIDTHKINVKRGIGKPCAIAITMY